MFKSSKNDIHTRNNYNYFDIMTLFQTKLVIYMYKDHKLQLVLLLCEPGNIHAYSNIKSLHMDQRRIMFLTPSKLVNIDCVVGELVNVDSFYLRLTSQQEPDFVFLWL